MIFYSQQGEDIFIYRNFINKKTSCGIFVELGAMDGIRFSNTKFFQDELDFSGTLIEPTCQFVDLQKNRPKCDLYNVAVSYKKETIKYLGTDATAGAVESMSVYHKNSWLDNSQEYLVQAVPFCDILSKSNLSYIDLLSIDVEGAELMVLETMDWSIPVFVIVIELDGSNPEKDEKCRHLLQKQGFVFYHRMCINEFWVHPNYFRKNFLWDPLVENYVFKNSKDLGKFLYLEKHVAPEIKKSLQEFKKPLLISGHSFYLECHWSICSRYPISFSPNEIKYGDKVFLNLDYFEPFLENLIKYAPANKFILVCHNSDLSFTKIHYEKIKPFVIHVFSTNCTFLHEKVSAIPLGFVDNKYKCHYKFELVEKKNKTNLLYMNFKIQTNPKARQLCFDHFKNQHWIKKSTDITFEKYCQECADSKFVLSPEGTGIDCHRIYEAIFLDTIPIIKSGCLDHFYIDLPIVIIDSWEQVNPEWLEMIYPILLDQSKTWKINNRQWKDAKFWLNIKNIL